MKCGRQALKLISYCLANGVYFNPPGRFAQSFFEKFAPGSRNREGVVVNYIVTMSDCARRCAPGGMELSAPGSLVLKADAKAFSAFDGAKLIRFL